MTDSQEMQALLNSLMHPELKAIDLSLDRIRHYLDAYGNPEQQLPPIVHVAGTNGKGSTIAFLRAMMQAAGYVVHVYTSPHLVHFRERYVVSGSEASDEMLIETLSQIYERSKEYPLTFFEATTVAAFELFAKHPADMVLLEVGLGGRYDASNVIHEVALSVITPISYDHMDYLGDSIGKITAEKAAIIKPQCPVVVAMQEPEAMEVIEEAARQAGCALYDCNAVNVAQEMVGLRGEHQLMNAKTAWASAIQLEKHGFVIPYDAKLQGLQKAQWRARLQKIESGSLADKVAEKATLYIDGGHNPAAAEMLAAWISAQEKPVHLLIAMIKGKDHLGFLEPLKHVAASITLTEIPEEFLSESAEALSVYMKDVPHEVMIDPLAALDAMVGHMKGADVILACGSLYFAGYLLAKNG